MGSNLGELFLKGGMVMWPLLLFSIVMWAVIMERTVIFLAIRPKLNRLAQSIIQALTQGDAKTAKQHCQTEKAPLSDLYLGAMDTKRTRDHAERVTERNRIRLRSYLRKNLWVLGTIGSASPFIGLLGTVLGIVRAFHDMAEQGAGGFSVVAAGISEALIATAAGLIVAIIALLTYNVFVTAANHTVTKVALSLDEILDYSFKKGYAK